MLSSKQSMAVSCLSDSSYDYLQKIGIAYIYHGNERAHEASPLSLQIYEQFMIAGGLGTGKMPMFL